MIRCERFERLAALANTIGCRLMRTGNGEYITLHQGKQHQLRSLGEVSAWLAFLHPEAIDAIADAARRNSRVQQNRKGGKPKPWGRVHA